MRANALAAVAVIALIAPAYAAERISGVVTHVRDIDTIEVDGLPIRLDGVDGPELNEKGGREAKRWMTRNYLRQRVTCELTGKKTYDRWAGTCFDRDGQDLGALAISAGHARDCPRFSGGRYSKVETAASRRQPQHSYCK